MKTIATFASYQQKYEEKTAIHAMHDWGIGFRRLPGASYQNNILYA